MEEDLKKETLVGKYKVVDTQKNIERQKIWHLKRIRKAAKEAMQHPDIRDVLEKSDPKFQHLSEVLHAYDHAFGGSK